MRKLDRIDIIQWVLLAIAVVIALAVWLQLSRFKAEAEALATNLASYNLQLMVVKDAMIAHEDYLETVGGVFKGCETAQNAGALTQCYGLNLPYARFLSAYSDAVMARASAKTPDEFRAVARAYRSTLKPLDVYAAIDPGNARYALQWRSRIEEGIAYAALRAGDLDTAAREIGLAADFDSRADFHSGLVGSTALKIACQRGDDPAAIRSEYETLIKELTAQTAAKMAIRGATEGQRDAQMEQHYLDGDDELFLRCAGLSKPR